MLRRRAPFDLEARVDLDDVVCCLPVYQEVLQGFQEAEAFRIAHDAMGALPFVEDPMHRDVYEDAIRLYRAARRSGVTVRSSVDCLIAACALRHDLLVLHDDRDFRALATVSELREESIRS